MAIKEDSSLLKRRLLSAIPGILALVAFGLSYVGNFYCDNIQFQPTIEVDHEDFLRPRTLSFGLWSYKHQKFTNRRNGQLVYTEYCSGYDEDTEFDSSWRVARAFSCVGVIVAGFLILWQFCAPFLLFDALYWRWAMAIFTFIGICQGLTLKFLSSDACKDNTMIGKMVSNPSIYPDECSWDWGSYTSLSGTIFYGLTVLSMFIIPAPGVRPNERKFPMMVWDDAELSEAEDKHDVDDDDSIESFAYDEFDPDNTRAKDVRQTQDVSETEVDHDDDDGEVCSEQSITVSDISNNDSISSLGDSRMIL